MDSGVIWNGSLEEETAQLERFLSLHGMRVESARTVEVYAGTRVREFIIEGEGGRQGKLCWGVRVVTPDTFGEYIPSYTSYGDEPPFYNERFLYILKGSLYQEGLLHNERIL